MIVEVLVLFLLLSIGLSFYSLKKLEHDKEIAFVNNELKKKRVIFDHSASSDESAA